jgi:hypothetical protein
VGSIEFIEKRPLHPHLTQFIIVFKLFSIYDEVPYATKLDQTIPGESKKRSFLFTQLTDF